MVKHLYYFNIIWWRALFLFYVDYFCELLDYDEFQVPTTIPKFQVVHVAYLDDLLPELPYSLYGKSLACNFACTCLDSSCSRSLRFELFLMAKYEFFCTPSIWRLVFGWRYVLNLIQWLNVLIDLLLMGEGLYDDNLDREHMVIWYLLALWILMFLTYKWSGIDVNNQDYTDLFKFVNSLVKHNGIK